MSKLEDHMFELVWQTIKGWDIEREPGQGYVHATGDDARTILDAISPLRDIVEAMETVEPYEPAIGERHELECLFCGELGDRLPNTQTTVSHTSDCAYMRARELCGLDRDGDE